MTGAMSTFDVTGPLPSGTTLIEASAGTGKTWTLSALVVRYVAEQGRPLDELLIVTFSRAASQELRERVRARLEESLTALERDGSADDDVLVRHLRDCSTDDLAARVERLRAAVADFDTATIATIHQFCHYVLKSLGIAGDSDPYATLAEDLADLRGEVVDDVFLAEHAAGRLTGVSYARACSDARAALDNPGAVLSPLGATGALGARLAFVDRVRAEFARRKRRAAVLGYDDLLSELASALEPDDSPARRRMREHWSVVLVDEFQDTDPVQWQVFSRAFDTVDKTLVLIGDPKQAIYGFRGGDVTTYLRAADTATTRVSLPTNFRSDAPLVQALQTLMANVQLSQGIVAHPITAQKPHHRLQGAPDNGPVRLRAMVGGTLSIGNARQNICTDAADDIARLLASGAEFDGEPVRPQHVAVLAHTNRDLHSMREALRDRGIPSVLVSSESVLRTTAASWWLHLLMALEQPHRPERVRLAALTPFLGWSAARLAEEGDSGTERVADGVRSLLTAYHRGGIAAVLDVVRGQGLDARLLAAVGGERDLTDVQHCAQLLQEKVLDGVGGLPSLVAWLMQQSSDQSAVTADSRIMRLDSDALAVTLSTIHGSKGLQYPIVYAPFLFDHWMKDDPTPAVIHRDGQRVLSFDSDEVNQPEHRSEALGENMRLAYVAMTRAQSQLVLWWAPTRNTSNSALHRLLFGQADTADQVAALLATRTAPDSGAAVTVPADKVPVRNPAASESVLQAWADHGAFTVAEVGDAPAAPPVIPTPSLLPLAARAFDATLVDQVWRRTSYSSLTANLDETAASTSEPEADAVGRDDEEPITVTGEPVATGPDMPSPMATHPVGAMFGSLVHAVLEVADLQADDLHAEIVAQIREQLVRWPVEVDVDTLATALVSVCTTPLGPIAHDVRLVDIAGSDRLAEMDFEVPLAGGDRPHTNARLRAMATVLRRHLPTDDPLRTYANALDGDGLGDQQLLGYLTGSIDLTFRHRGRFYVVDYKTNWLGVPGADLSVADYTPARMTAAMNHSSYPLQAILYSVVLHRYLRWRLPGYNPEEHLGGVMYLYVRGMAGPDTPVVDGQPCGVFAWQPPAVLLEELSAVLDGRSADGQLVDTPHTDDSREVTT